MNLVAIIFLAALSSHLSSGCGFGMMSSGGGCGGGCGRKKREISLGKGEMSIADANNSSVFMQSINSTELLCNSGLLRKVLEQGMRRSASDSRDALQKLLEEDHIIDCSRSESFLVFPKFAHYCSLHRFGHHCHIIEI